MSVTYTVERSATLSAPPLAVYALIEDFHRWVEWSPWEELDPDVQRTYSGTTHGVGAIYAWSGNKKAGQGRMEISEAVPGRKVRIRLAFVKPFKSSNVTTFTLTEEGKGTRVVWQMVGPKPFMMRMLGFVFNMDKLVGKDFEKGLAKLEQASSSS
ncbi:MAG TPA: SRPBCC family protein [Nocardioidaceae bacterium]|nr:SRPBCC family protein [Nocardioidaceae bacterium]